MVAEVSVATADELPVINIAPLYCANATREEKDAVAAAVRTACIDTGFFYVSGHGISAAAVLKCMHQLFGLPQEAKAKLDANFSPLHRGYTGLGGSHNCVPENSCVVGPDMKESYLLGAEGSRSPMHGPNTWPDPAQLPSWQQHVQDYFSAMLQLSRVVARALALSLNLPEQFFVDKMQDPVAQLLLLRYPPPPPVQANADGQQAATPAVAAADQAAAEQLQQQSHSQQQQQSDDSKQQQYVGCGAHTDCGFLTILAQDDVPGLQVKMASNKWVIAPTIPGAFLVNLGDMTAMWTRGLYKSTEHRVFNNSNRARYSAPFFCNCDFHATVEPADIPAAAGGRVSTASSGSTSSVGGAMYVPIKAGHYIMQKLGLMWDEPPSQ